MRSTSFRPRTFIEMHAIDLSVYLVLDPDLCGGFRGMIDTALAAAQNGATVVQLRAPKWKKRALAECARELKTGLAPFHVPLIINDHADVCAAVKADGLHIGQEDLSPADARAVIGPDCILGQSVSNAAELKAVDVGLVDHIGIGPVYSTATKTDAGPQLGIEGFAKLASHKPCPVVAIGSVKATMAAELFAAGADGLAVVSAICGQPDPGLAAKQLAQAVFAAKAAQAKLSSCSQIP